MNGQNLSDEPSQTLSDQTIWMLAIRDERDKQAYSQLFDYFAPKLKGFILRSGVSGAEAEDIVQDVMLS